MPGRTLRQLACAAAVATGIGLAAARASAAGVPVDQANESQKTTATEHFEDGMSLFDEEKYDEALAAFRASYEAVASPNSHLLVARSLARLGRSDDAYNEYTRVIDEATQLGAHYDAAATSARNEREQVRRRVALLTVEMPDPPADVEVTVNGKPVDLGKMPVAVNVGDVLVEARAPDGTTTSRTAKAEAGAALKVRLVKAAAPKVEPVEKPERPPPADTRSSGQKFRREASYIAAAVGVGGIATWAVITIAGADTLDDVAIGGLLLGGVGVGAAVVLYLTSEPAPAAGGPSEPRGQTRIAIGPGSVAVQGTF